VTETTLYVICGSHACATGKLLLRHKDVAHRTVTFPSGMHPMLARFAGFKGGDGPLRPVDGEARAQITMLDRMGTVPALSMDGDRVQTNIAIARHLDRVRPRRPLFPGDFDERREVEAAEAWGDEVLQMVARRIVLRAGQTGAVTGDDGRLGPLIMKSPRARRGVTAVAARIFEADRDADAKLRAELPAHLDRIDAWIGAGVLDRDDDLTAADYMIAPSLALLAYCPELEADIVERPAGRLLGRVFA
jgi:glutathione S-transferase